ncbi:hypothetical protein [Streptomyces mirabilis]|uniref:hypothetical protein n=1 Tax=Streptomyces mirabilis TaxID=68239 RepID=UPI0032536426
MEEPPRAVHVRDLAVVRVDLGAGGMGVVLHHRGAEGVRGERALPDIDYLDVDY